DEWVEAEVDLPAIVSCAERLIDPCKVKDPQAWAGVDASLITTVSAAELGDGPWGQDGSPTWVGTTRTIAVSRANQVVTGSLQEQVEAVAAALDDRAALVEEEDDERDGTVPAGGGDGPLVAVLVEPDRARITRELLGEAARLAADHG